MIFGSRSRSSSAFNHRARCRSPPSVPTTRASVPFQIGRGDQHLAAVVVANAVLIQKALVARFPARQNCAFRLPGCNRPRHGSRRCCAPSGDRPAGLFFQQRNAGVRVDINQLHAVDMPMMPPPIITKSYIRSILCATDASGSGEWRKRNSHAAHQFTAQIRVRSKAVATVQPNRLLINRNLPTGTGTERMPFWFQWHRKARSTTRLLQNLLVDELVDITHHRATLLINVEHGWKTSLLTFLLGGAAKRIGRAPAGGGNSGRDVPSHRDAAERISALHVLLVDFHHQHIVGISST